MLDVEWVVSFDLRYRYKDASERTSYGSRAHVTAFASFSELECI